MKGTIKLKNPVMINGVSIAEMDYDTNEIDGILFATAESKKKAAGNNPAMSPAAEFDYSLHLYLGYAAIIAINPGYAFEDLERMKGKDVVDVMMIGRNFILRSERGEQDGGSEKPTEITQESTTPVLPILNERES